VKPIYEDLSNDELLSRCLGDFTQNSNENFNVTVWAMTKTVASGKTILNIATNIAVCYFNDVFKMEIMKVLNLAVGIPIQLFQFL